MGQTGIQDSLLIGRRKRRRVPTWLQAGVVFLVVASAIGLITWRFYQQANSALIAEIHAGLLRTAAIALRSIDVERHKTFTKPEDELSGAYQRAIRPFRDILNADPNVAYVYSAVLIDGRVHFILDGTPPPSSPDVEDTSVDVMQEYDDPPPALLAALLEGKQMVSAPYTDEWGTFISAYEPFWDGAGKLVGVVGIDLRLDNYLLRLAPVKIAAYTALGAGLIVALLMAGSVIIIRKTDRTARDLARQLRMVNALLAVSRAMGPTVALNELFPVIAKQLGSILGVQSARLHLVAPGGKVTTYDASGQLRDGPQVPAGLLAETLQARRPLIVGNAGKDQRLDRASDVPDGVDPRDMLLMPVLADGKPVAVMQATNTLDGEGFDDETIIILGAIGAQIQGAIDRARLADAYVEKLKLDESLKLAASIQMSMLSKSFPPPSGVVDIHASLLPAKHVGGDFYDFFWIDQYRLAFLVADVSGKGVPAALFMAKAKTVIKGHAVGRSDPAAIIALANDDLSADNDNGMFVTVLFGILDSRNGELHWCNAGHNPAYVIPASGAAPEPLRLQPGIALGVMDGMEFTTESTRLGPGDAVFLYTDGVNEAMDVDNNQFDYPRLVEVLSAVAPSVDEINNAVIAAVSKFAEGAEQSDDITVLALRWRGH